MSKDPIEFLDSVLQEEELRWRMDEYGHDKRKYSISRSGRYKSINKKRDALKPELYKGSDVDKKTRPATSGAKENNSSSVYQIQQQSSQQHQSRTREKEPKYTKYYETNL